MLPNFNWLLGLGLLGAASSAHSIQLSKHAQDLFDESMFFQDMIYDPNAHYLRFFYYPLAAGVHETRSTVWRTVGLLQRNHGDDAAEAAKILELVIADQEKDTSKQWYGDYTVYPEQPTVGDPAYDPVVCWIPPFYVKRQTYRLCRYITLGIQTGEASSAQLLSSFTKNIETCFHPMFKT